MCASLMVFAVAALNMSHKSVMRVVSRLYGSNLRTGWSDIISRSPTDPKAIILLPSLLPAGPGSSTPCQCYDSTLFHEDAAKRERVRSAQVNREARVHLPAPCVILFFFALPISGTSRAGLWPLYCSCGNDEYAAQGVGMVCASALHTGWRCHCLLSSGRVCVAGGFVRAPAAASGRWHKRCKSADFAAAWSRLHWA